MSTKYDNKIDEIRVMMSNLLENIVVANQLSLDAYICNNQDGFKEAQDKLVNIAAQGDMIDNEIIKTFALFGPEARELRSLVAYLKMTNEIISIGAGVKKICSPYARPLSE